MIAAALGALISFFLYLNVVFGEFRVQRMQLRFVLGNEQTESFGIFPAENILKTYKPLEQYDFSFDSELGKIFISEGLVERALTRDGELSAGWHGIHRIDSGILCKRCPVEWN